MEEGLNSFSIATLTFCCGVAGIIVAFLIPLLGGEAINFKPLLDKRVFILLVTIIITSALAGFMITYATKHLSATFVSMCEIAYPIFVPIMVYIFFGQNQISTHTILGGAFVIVGIYTLMTGEFLKERGMGSSAPVVIAQTVERGRDAPLS